MKQLKDRDGNVFTGTPEELRRHNGKLRQRARRAKFANWVELPLPAGIAKALEKCQKRSGMKDARELISLMLFNLADAEGHVFDAVTAIPKQDFGDLDKYMPALRDAAQQAEDYD